MRIVGDHVIFNTGKQIYAHLGIVGISPDLDVSEGYDGGLDIDELTPEEKVELVNYMLLQWEKFKLSLPSKYR